MAQEDKKWGFNLFRTFLSSSALCTTTYACTAQDYMKCIVLVAYQTRKDIQKPLTLIIIKCQNNKIPFSTLPIHALHVQTVIVIYYRQACSSFICTCYCIHPVV